MTLYIRECYPCGGIRLNGSKSCEGSRSPARDLLVLTGNIGVS